MFFKHITYLVIPYYYKQCTVDYLIVSDIIYLNANLLAVSMWLSIKPFMNSGRVFKDGRGIEMLEGREKIYSEREKERGPLNN